MNAWEFILPCQKLFMHKDRGTCTGICKEFKVRKPRDGSSRYLSGQVRCQICGVFMLREACHDREDKPATDETVDLYCNCCNCMVRSRPRNKPGSKSKKTPEEEYNELKKKY
ncbi:hypothetical protein NSIN_20752 [Nitrosotalea sinensis]|uniref:Uncharacterized protein n=2 Tax=Nitrosotalea sinensis TaxID=1499975 RepID=A0A2H1EH89_9ARCH|nr:hypothetical protein NSIN_20752 [Candidatus Nitrosotalea sinensis]